MRLQSLLQIAVVLLFAGVAPLVGQLRESVPPQPARQQPDVAREHVISDGLRTLKYQTAWIFLGLIKSDGKWGIEPDFKFIKINGSQPAQEPALPKVGDQIRLLSNTRLVILDFIVSGEAKRLESPAKQPRLTRDDSTLIMLPVDSGVEVREVQTGPHGPGQMRAVWARVVPLNQK